MKIKKGDKVKILRGKDKNRIGTVEVVLEKENKVLVSGVNVYKKHTKPRREGEKGGIIEKSRPLDVSKVALICPKCNQPTRVGYQITGNEKLRICKKCQAQI